MPKLFLMVMVLAMGSCSSGSLRSGGAGGHGGNAGSSGSTGGVLGTGGHIGAGGVGGTGGAIPSPDAALDGRLDAGMDASFSEAVLATDQDGATIDAPPADVAGDTASTAGCDSSVAATTLSALGIVAAGDSRTLSATLPAVLATDSNWGLKASVCQQAGYDITVLAGKTVCLFGQDMNQLCQGIPSTAWVMMDKGAVACVYKTVRPELATAPGVYAANDANCTPSAIEPGATVACEGRSCTNATGPCCPATQLMNRVGMCGSGCSVAVTCDGPEDCSNGAVCCSHESASGLAGTSCVNPAQCAAPSRVICRQQSDCLASQTCGAPNPMPAYISTYPYEESTSWRVAYQVCAP